MKTDTYDYIWEEIVKDNINDLYKQLTDAEKLKLNVKPLSIEKQTVYEKYVYENRRIKELYHHEKNQEILIDVHKIAACFTKVLLEEKVFHYSLKEHISDNIILINARLAYNVGLGLIRMNLIAAYLNLSRQDIVDQLLSVKQLKVPTTNEGHDEYHSGRQKTLLLNDVFENEFDILTYSDMLFWIEYHNRQLLEGVIKPQALSIIDWSSN